MPSGSYGVGMMWQDIVIMCACFSFALALIPSIRGPNKPARATCAMTVIALTAVAVCFGTLGLHLALASEITGITAWGILLFQKRRR